MLAQPPIWLIAVAFLAAIGPLIILHELGHYWMARVLGVGAETFSIGFGKTLFSWRDRRGTEWRVAALPLGGYVRFVGDEDASSRPSNEPGLPVDKKSPIFHRRAVWQRFLIVLAGPMANFLVAIAIISVFFAVIGAPRTETTVTRVKVGSVAERAGIDIGDRIVAIDGRPVATFEEVSSTISIRPLEPALLTVERDGRRFERQVTIGVDEERDRFGQKFRVGRLGVYGELQRYQQLPVSAVVPAAVGATVNLTRSMVEVLWQIVSGRRSVKDLGGPLKIAQVAGQQASLGIQSFVMLVALISINLGFINLLPVPMLDGGHLLFYTLEAIRRRPVSLVAQEWAFRGGLALLLGLLLFTTFNDLGSFGLWDRLGRLIG